MKKIVLITLCALFIASSASARETWTMWRVFYNPNARVFTKDSIIVHRMEDNIYKNQAACITEAEIFSIQSKYEYLCRPSTMTYQDVFRSAGGFIK